MDTKSRRASIVPAASKAGAVERRRSMSIRLLAVTTQGLGAIVRVSPANGSFTFFQVGGSPRWMTSAHHVLIYTDRAGTQISVMDVKGNAKVYPTPVGVTAGFVASKPDGTVLFNDVKTNAIGTFDPATRAFGAEVQPFSAIAANPQVP